MTKVIVTVKKEKKAKEKEGKCKRKREKENLYLFLLFIYKLFYIHNKLRLWQIGSLDFNLAVILVNEKFH